MRRRIQPLPPQLANQIAAGEVVERPASVVKELLENSIDAGADRIELELEQGGCKKIRVLDNGSGIHRDDLPLALSPHATSKIYTQKELEGISSLGFRGEALASIASVSRFSLCSRQEGEQSGWQVSHDGKGSVTAVTPCARPPGTSVEVRELFFNIPARRKFLRSERTEFLHVEEVVKRLALSRFDVAFSVTHNNRKVFRSRQAGDETQQLRRVGEVLGKGFIQHAVSLTFNAAGMHLQGWLARPTYSRSQADTQYFYLNGRMVRDKLINHAVRLAHQTVLDPGRYPAFVLYLEVDPRQVDINVHPTKHEVRFRESRLVHDFIQRALVNALEEGSLQETGAQEESVIHPKATTEVRSTPLKGSGRGGAAYSRSPGPARIADQLGFYQSAGKKSSGRPNRLSDSGPSRQVLAVLHDRYLLAESEKGPLLIDLHTVRQRVITRRFEQMLSDGEVQGHPLLIPLNLTLDKRTVEQWPSITGSLVRLGFVIEPLGPAEVVVREVPILIRGSDVEQLLQRLFTLLQQSDSQISMSIETIIQHLALYAVETAQAPSLSDAGRTLRELETLQEPVQDLGRPLTAEQLAQWINGKD